MYILTARLDKGDEELYEFVYDLLLLVVFLSETENLPPQCLVLTAHAVQLPVYLLLPLPQRSNLHQHVIHLQCLLFSAMCAPLNKRLTWRLASNSPSQYHIITLVIKYLLPPTHKAESGNPPCLF